MSEINLIALMLTMINEKDWICPECLGANKHEEDCMMEMFLHNKPEVKDEQEKENVE